MGPPWEAGIHAKSRRMAFEAEGVPNTKALIGTGLSMGMGGWGENGGREMRLRQEMDFAGP